MKIRGVRGYKGTLKGRGRSGCLIRRMIKPVTVKSVNKFNVNPIKVITCLKLDVKTNRSAIADCVNIA